MSSQGHSPPIAYTPDYHQSEQAVPTPSSDPSITLRNLPAVYFGQPIHNRAKQQVQACDHSKRDHGSLSSASTDSSCGTTPRPRSGPIHIYSPTFSMSSRAEEGSLENSSLARAYPNQYTRPSRSEMAEISAAYQQSHEDDDSSETSEDHAIWVLVCCSLAVYRCIMLTRNSFG